jgi:hypothetical protein
LLPPDGPHADAPEQNTIGQLPYVGGTAPFAVPDAARKPRTRRHPALFATAVGTSYVALAAGAAAAVVGLASPAPVNIAALASASQSVSASAAASASGTSSATAANGSGSPKATPSSSPSPSASPSPRSTVTGSVRNGAHRGDLRYFLLPPPDGPSSVQGDPDGTLEGANDVLKQYGGDSQVKSALDQLGFKTGATRTYQDGTLGANVTIELLQFGSADDAGQWLQGFELNGSGWTSFSVPGESGASARERNSDGLDKLVGVYAEGDTFYQIDVYGSQTLPHADLSNLMTAESGRLSHG